jgi:hypothetical protein
MTNKTEKGHPYIQMNPSGPMLTSADMEQLALHLVTASLTAQMSEGQMVILRNTLIMWITQGAIPKRRKEICTEFTDMVSRFWSASKVDGIRV